MQHKLTVSSIAAYAVVLGGAVIMLLPFWFMFVFATRSDAEILSVPPPIWFGNALLANLNQLLERLPYFWHNLSMSFYVATATTLANLFFCSLAGYGFAMYDFKYKGTAFAIVLGTTLLPAFLSMIPSVLIFTLFDWMNQPRALIVPGMCAAFGVFMMRQYIATAIPKDLIEAARIDGCTEFGIFWRIIVPLVTPAFGTLGLVTFIGTWNNFMSPLVVMRDMEMFTVPLALRSLAGTGQVPYGAIAAGSAIAVLPLLVMFVLASKRLIEGMTAGAVKA
ncbi:carbohydrate ABC transporter permease [Chitinivorax sp. B]|uniref:carbohydrate ABC transporter permease n=1 Tax=Chitinivorax sp. B TaxID=2502235 RepID=UPI0010F9CD8F|nr:carbohydrate ABC transporter permease [Chitinivorax sp. B]